MAEKTITLYENEYGTLKRVLENGKIKSTYVVDKDGHIYENGGHFDAVYRDWSPEVPKVVDPWTGTCGFTRF